MTNDTIPLNESGTIRIIINTDGWEDTTTDKKIIPDMTYTGSLFDIENPAEYKKICQKNRTVMFKGEPPIKKEPETDTQFTSLMRKCSTVPIYKTSSMDGKIDYVKQGQTGDCGLLAALNSIASTEEGQKIIKESLEYGERGAYVNFRGLKNCKIYVPYSEVKLAKLRLAYSAGDDDAKIIELAIRKVIKEVRKGNINGYYLPEDCMRGNLLYGVDPCMVMRLFTGNGTYNYGISKLPKDYNFAVYSFMNEDYPNDMKFDWMTLGLGKRRKLKDAKTGKTVYLRSCHAYTIKSISEDGIAELVNPWNNKKSIYVRTSDIEKGYFYYAKANEPEE